MIFYVCYIKNIVDLFPQITFQYIYCSASVCKPYNHKKHACCFQKCTENLSTLVAGCDALNVSAVIHGRM